jgi:hypothetical protein
MTQAELNEEAEGMCSRATDARVKTLILTTYTWHVETYILDKYKLSLPYCLEPYKE